MSKRIESGIVVAIGALTILSTATLIHDQDAGRSDSVSRWIDGNVKKVEAWVSTRAVTANAKSSPVVQTNSATGLPGQAGSRNTASSSGNTTTTGNQARGGAQSAGSVPVIPAVPTTSAAGYPDKSVPEPETNAPVPTLKSTEVGGAAGQLTNQLQAQGWSKQDISSFAGILSRFVASMNQTDWVSLEQALSPASSTSQSQDEVLSLLNQHLSSTDKQWLLMHFQGNMAFSKVDVQLLKEAFVELQDDLTSGEQQLLSQQVGQLLTGSTATN